MWDDLCRGAIGAIVLVDTARLNEAFSPLDYFEAKGIPFIVCVNEFEGTQKYPMPEIREALALREEVPIMAVDARDRDSAKTALVRVTEFALEQLTKTAAAAQARPLRAITAVVCLDECARSALVRHTTLVASGSSTPPPQAGTHLCSGAGPSAQSLNRFEVGLGVSPDRVVGASRHS